MTAPRRPWTEWAARTVCGVVAAAAGFCPAAAMAADPSETLVVFTRSDAGSAVAEHFASATQPALAALAQGLGVRLTVVDVAEAGAPAEVGLTPLIVFQNHRGRSVYQGRTDTLDRVRNLVRTARFRPQAAAVLELPGVPFARRGRMTLATPIKVTALSGVLPPGLDPQAFGERAAGWVRDAAAARGARAARPARLGRSDRQFYLDFHPHLSADGVLSLGVAVYSQFHCHEPVFEQVQTPLQGAWDDRAALFGRAYNRLMDAVEGVVARSTLGDGFDPVPADAPVVTWAALGLALPPAPVNASPPPVAINHWPTEWVMVASGPGQRPAVQFAFAAPLDAYRGEATRVSGRLTLGQGAEGADGARGGVIGGATGRFSADPASVTMGEADLDAEIRASMLDVIRHPESFFVLERTEARAVAPDFGVLAPAVLHGRFTMKGHTVPLVVTASFEPITTADGDLRLVLDGRWPLGLLRPFGIDGPSGDRQRGDTLEFTARLVFEPARAPAER